MNDHWLLAFIRKIFGKRRPPAPAASTASLFEIPPERPSAPARPVTGSPPSFLLPRDSRSTPLPSTIILPATMPSPPSFDGPTAPAAPAVPKKRMYVNSHIGLRVRSEPHIGNNILEILTYGDMVRIDRQEDSWAHVEYASGHTGWVSTYYLSEDMPADALHTPVPSRVPHFIVGQPNRADDANTVEVRRVIHDEFGGGANKWDLQCTEYVQYKLAVRGTAIRWPSDRPRNGGKWAEIFERNGMYGVSDDPTVGCAMSFTAGFSTSESNDIGHVAYVEGVFADGAVKVSEANWPPPGRYNERIISKNEWSDRYKAKFVQFV